MNKRYTVVIYSPQDLNHSSYVHSALFDLEKSGEIKCELKIDISPKKGRVSTKSGHPVNSKNPQQKTSYYKIIDNQDNTELFFATDLYDIPYYFSEFALKKCDYIFKRNYINEFVSPLENFTEAKILPFGLSFGVLSHNLKKWNIIKMAYFISILGLNLKLDKLILKRILKSVRTTFKHIEYVTNGRSLDLFNNYNPSTKLQVFYQVRCFPSIDAEDVKMIHNQRSSLIRLLKRGLGDYFVGGIVPSQIAYELFEDCITNEKTDPVSYLNLIKNSKICIYTKGLENSPARKLPEYLSQAKCIVAERFSTELPLPLEHGKNIMYFDTNEECLEICKSLLNNPSKINILSINARSYYEENILPENNLKRVLKIMGCDL